MSLCCGLENNSQKALNPRHFLKKHRAAVGLAYSFLSVLGAKRRRKKALLAALCIFSTVPLLFVEKPAVWGFASPKSARAAGAPSFPPFVPRRNLCAREAVDLPLMGKVAATEWLTERENP